MKRFTDCSRSVLIIAIIPGLNCGLLSAASAVHTDHPKRRKVVSAWPFQGLFCMPAGSPLQATAPRSERPRRMHALTCLGLESAGLNNCRSSWQSEIVDVLISPTRVRIPLAPFSRSRPPFPRFFSQTNSDSPLFPAIYECLTLPCMCLWNIRKRTFAASHYHRSGINPCFATLKKLEKI